MCYGKGYWKNHNAFAANPAHQQAWPIDENTNLCGSSWLQLIGQPSLGDAWVILGKHYVTAKLNQANGGFVPAEIASSLLMAGNLLAACQVSDADREFALQLKDTLEAYNNTPDCQENAPQQPAEPEVEIPAGKALVHIHSIYDLDGEDVSALGIPFMAIPSLLTMDQRDERFVRVLTRKNDGSDQWEIQGYTDIQPDGSVIFEVPADTDYSFEVINKDGKALNQVGTQGSDFQYSYLQRHPGALRADEGEKQQCHGCHVAGNEEAPAHAHSLSAPINQGASGISLPWPSANPFILSVSWGDTMAEALYKSIENVGQLTPAIKYQDNWTLLPFRQNPAINIDYAQLTTTKPVTVACEQDMTADCTANINYRDHIQPIWNAANRNEAGNSCVDCHDNRGFTQLNLSDDPALLEGFASLNALTSNNRNYMYLSATFNEVDAEHCRRYVSFPFDINELASDCFSCYSQALMSPQGALNSVNFFDLFDTDESDDHLLFRPIALDAAAKAMHQGMLNSSEKKLIAEWLDMGAPQ